MNDCVLQGFRPWTGYQEATEGFSADLRAYVTALISERVEALKRLGSPSEEVRTAVEWWEGAWAG